MPSATPQMAEVLAMQTVMEPLRVLQLASGLPHEKSYSAKSVTGRYPIRW